MDKILNKLKGKYIKLNEQLQFNIVKAFFIENGYKWVSLNTSTAIIDYSTIYVRSGEDTVGLAYKKWLEDIKERQIISFEQFTKVIQLRPRDKASELTKLKQIVIHENIGRMTFVTYDNRVVRSQKSKEEEYNIMTGITVGLYKLTMPEDFKIKMEFAEKYHLQYQHLLFGHLVEAKMISPRQMIKLHKAIEDLDGEVNINGNIIELKHLERI